MAAKKKKGFIGIILSLIGQLFCVAMIALTFWTLGTLLKGLYLPGKVQVVKKGEHEGDMSDLDRRLESVSRSRDYRKHFHNVDKSIFIEDRDPPLCLACHGNMPHTKALEMRALLNMHTYFIACEICHVRRAPEDNTIFFAWIDYETKQEIYEIEEENWGNYGAKIIPFKKIGRKEPVRMDKPLNEQYAIDYLKNSFSWSTEKRAKAKAIIHEGHVKNPILCNECHAKDGYLPFEEELLYSEKRASQLFGTAAAGMVERYIEFYLPTMFDPDLVEKRKLLKEKTEAAKDEGVFDLGMEDQ